MNFRLPQQIRRDRLMWCRYVWSRMFLRFHQLIKNSMPCFLYIRSNHSTKMCQHSNNYIISKSLLFVGSGAWLGCSTLVNNPSNINTIQKNKIFTQFTCKAEECPRRRVWAPSFPWRFEWGFPVPEAVPRWRLRRRIRLETTFRLWCAEYDRASRCPRSPKRSLVRASCSRSDC